LRIFFHSRLRGIESKTLESIASELAVENSVHASTELRANGNRLEIISKCPLMLSLIEAWNRFFDSL
jgi:hypothetical protein